MAKRREMDRPAAVTAATLGFVLIAISVPFVIGGENGSKSYAITWSEAASGFDQAPGSPEPGSAEASVTVNHRIPSTATIEFAPCSDGAIPSLTPMASIDWALFEGDQQKGSGSASCANSGPFEVPLEVQPDIASVVASSSNDAERAVYENAGINKTATFRLVFSWARAGALPVVPQPPFATTAQLEIHEWRATANLPDQQGAR